MPTYAFTRERYWLEPSGAKSDIGSPGSRRRSIRCSVRACRLRTPTAICSAACFRAGVTPGCEVTRCSTRRWSRARVRGAALAAAQRVGLDGIEELTIESPLVLPERGAVQLQLFVGALDESGTRPFTLHARAEAHARDWVRYATATLSDRVESVGSDRPARLAAGGCRDAAARRFVRGVGGAWDRVPRMLPRFARMLSVRRRSVCGGRATVGSGRRARLGLRAAPGTIRRSPARAHGRASGGRRADAAGCVARRLRAVRCGRPAGPSVARGQRSVSLSLADARGMPLGRCERFDRARYRSSRPCGIAALRGSLPRRLGACCDRRTRERARWAFWAMSR